MCTVDKYQYQSSLGVSTLPDQHLSTAFYGRSNVRLHVGPVHYFYETGFLLCTGKLLNVMSTGLQFKVVLLGEAGVGKTTLFLRLKDGYFHPRARTAAGVESCTKQYMVKDIPVRLEIWDTAGVERFRTMTSNYYRNAQGAVFVYSVDNMSSLQLLPQWVDDSDNTAPDALKILLGNKADRPSEVSSESAQDFADIYNCECSCKASAKSGDGVEDVFRTIAIKLLEQRQRSQSYLNEVNLFDSSLNSTRNTSDSRCCH